MVDNYLHSLMLRQLADTSLEFKRYLYDEIPDARLVGITGPRGVGKSTLVLQKIKESEKKCLYVDADNLYFATHSLVRLAEDFVKDGGELLAIDEIHKYEGWSRELKQIYDTNHELHVIFTGSSVLDIKKGSADLSRRALMFHMQGLSFREYLDLFHDRKIKPYSLEEILNHEVEMLSKESILPEHPLPYFRDYLVKGYFPFSDEPRYELRLNQIISQTVESDIPLFAGFTAATARKLKQLMGVLSRLAPYKPSIKKLAQEIGVSKNTLPDYLAMLEKAGMIALLRDDTSGLRTLGKIEKLYIDNTNFMYAMVGVKTDIGNVRETFFQNQMRVGYDLSVSRFSDFRIGDYTFEVGGKNKGQKQLEGIPNGIVVKDDIEFGSYNIVPLWHFGLTY